MVSFRGLSEWPPLSLDLSRSAGTTLFRDRRRTSNLEQRSAVEADRAEAFQSELPELGERSIIRSTGMDERDCVVERERRNVYRSVAAALLRGRLVDHAGRDADVPGLCPADFPVI